jgi:hypothetical protein
MPKAYAYPKVGTYGRDGKPTLAPVRKGARRPGQKAEIGAAAAFQRMLVREAYLWEQATEHQANGEGVLAQQEWEQWEKIASSIGTSETRDIKNRYHRGELIPQSLVDKEYDEFLSRHPDALRAGVKSIIERLTNQPPAAFEKDVDMLVDDLFREMPERLSILEPKR